MAVFHLKNKQLSVSVNSFGAELCSLKRNTEELMWQGNKSIWPRHAPVLFPIVGKLKENKYNYLGNEYVLPQHGFARDFDFVLIEQGDSVLEFELTATEETLKIFPFHFSLIIRYELKDNEVKISYKVFNPANGELFFSIGVHPGFCCIGGLSNYNLEFENNTELICEKLKDGLLSGESYSIKLQNKVLPLNPELFENDALVLKNSQINSVNLVSKTSNVKIKLDCKNWPYFGIWTKKNCNDFVCLEPWYGIADGITASGDLKEKEGILKLMAGETFFTGYRMEISG